MAVTNNKTPKVKIITKGISHDDFIDILVKAHKHKHEDGDGCKYSNPLMDKLTDEMNSYYKKTIALAISEVIKELFENVNI